MIIIIIEEDLFASNSDGTPLLLILDKRHKHKLLINGLVFEFIVYFVDTADSASVRFIELPKQPK